MRRSCALLIGTCMLVLSCAAQSDSAATPIRQKFKMYLSDLLPGDALTIEWHSDGCFHSVAYSFKFTKQEGIAVEVTCERGCYRLLDSMEVQQPPGMIGRKQMSRSEVRRFDNYLSSLLSEESCQSTTREQVELNLVPAKGKKHRSRIKYNLCRFPDDPQDQLSFEGLIILAER